MSKMFLVLLLLFASSICNATTVTASVAGTLKVYQHLQATKVSDVVFPAQYAQTLTYDVINVNGAAPATGIPSITGETVGQAGKVDVSGTPGTIFSSSIAPTMTLTGPSTISAEMSIWGDVGYTTAVPTVVGTPNTGMFVKGGIHSGTVLVAGMYTGSVNVTISYN